MANPRYKPKHGPNAFLKTVQTFNLSFGERERAALSELADREAMSQSAIMRRCLMETYNRVTGRSPLTFTSFQTMPNQLLETPSPHTDTEIPLDDKL